MGREMEDGERVGILVDRWKMWREMEYGDIWKTGR
jgi:hypothetical protein